MPFLFPGLKQNENKNWIRRQLKLGQSWTRTGLKLDRTWIVYWTRTRQKQANQNLVKTELEMDLNWTRQKLDGKWMRCELKMNIIWPKSDVKLDQEWTKTWVRTGYYKNRVHINGGAVIKSPNQCLNPSSDH